MKQTPETIRAALVLLALYTRNRFDVFALAGPSGAAKRQAVMGALVSPGKTPPPRSKCGVNALRTALYAATNVAGKGSCSAERERLFAEQAKALVAADK